jgi:hypothetical protein
MELTQEKRREEEKENPASIKRGIARNFLVPVPHRVLQIRAENALPFAVHQL